MADQEFDLAVIGLGSAGMVAVNFATGLGVRVAAVERDRVGGDCLWTGCVPSKTLLAEAARRSAAPAQSGSDLEAVWGRIRAVQEEIAAGDDSVDRLREGGAEVYLGEPARLVAPHQVRVGSRSLCARNILVCTGSRPAVPPIRGLAAAGFVTSSDFFAKPPPPGPLLFIGGGPISLELAQGMRRFGREVTVLEVAPRILPLEEPELVERLVGALRADGVTIETGAQVLEVGGTAGALTVDAEVRGERRRLPASQVFVGAGRVPNVEGLGLEDLGVRLGSGGVKVDQALRTGVPGLFACGDVIWGYRFTHSAGHQAVQAVRGMFFPGLGRAPQLVPWCTFTDPQLAHVGLTEAEARHTQSKVRVWRSDLSHSDRARADGRALGEVRLVASGDRLVGAHILSPTAGEMIHEPALAISAKLRVQSLSSLVHVYPTYSTSVGEAAALAGLERARRLRSRLSWWPR